MIRDRVPRARIKGVYSASLALVVRVRVYTAWHYFFAFNHQIERSYCRLSKKISVSCNRELMQMRGTKLVAYAKTKDHAI